MTERNTILGSNLESAFSALKKGNLVAIPTETVYGLGGNGLDADAIAKIFEAKNRPKFDPLILHIGDISQVDSLTTEFPKKAKQLAQKFWPGPLTLILPKSDRVPDIATSGLNSVGVRMPNHPLTLDLLRALPFPIAAPSANPFGYVSPTTAQHVLDQLDGRIDYILDGGPCEIGIESTIVSFVGNTPTILRHGGVSQADIENEIGPIDALTKSSSRPDAPGMLVSHYAPKKTVLLGNIKELIEQHKDKRYAVLGFLSSYGKSGEVLSKSGNLNEAAKNLFAALRRLDAAPIDFILTENVPNVGLGMAINDKLQRAATKGL